MERSQLLAHCGSWRITREELKVIPTPAGSATHQPLHPLRDHYIESHGGEDQGQEAETSQNPCGHSRLPERIADLVGHRFHCKHRQVCIQRRGCAAYGR
jgi:hypothetical protein